MRELHTPEQAVQWLRARAARALCSDSRQVRAGDAFIAWPGAATDARAYVDAARRAGAVACLVERDGVDAFGLDGEDLAALRGLKAATGPIASVWHGEPSQALNVAAVTGTNGKTSTTWWLAQAISKIKRNTTVSCGIVGTLGTGVLPDIVHNGLTTPDPVLLARTLRAFADQGVTVCAMEASSIGIAEHRLDGTRIAVAAFTNFTRDHLDYHGSMDAYWRAKRALFDWPGLRAAVVHVDDPKGRELANQLAGRLDLWTVGTAGDARLQARAIGYRRTEQGEGLTFEVREGDGWVPVHTHLVGDYNVANLLVVLGCLRALGYRLPMAADSCAHLNPVPGRMERLGGDGQPLVVVDYAHTPDALEQVLRALRSLAAGRGGRLWCVFGCGGDRDAGKRAQMGAAAERLADAVVLTSDNPRSEPPQAILAQICAGMTRPPWLVESDRARAINEVVARQAAAADVVLLAGKGHEDYQEIAGVRRPFSDRAQALAALAQREPTTQEQP
ncbi:MAG: UDP-N-acetylmuramoyl-L-alanyl-D-glutamate--2,6-diaminopimelate ligase [Tibeticola sp.]